MSPLTGGWEHTGGPSQSTRGRSSDLFGREGGPNGRELGLGPLLAGGAARTGQLLGQRVAHEGLHTHVVPHAKLFQPTGDATRNSSRELDELFIVD